MSLVPRLPTQECLAEVDEPNAEGTAVGRSMNRIAEAKNKELVLEAFDTLFNKRDYTAAEKFWSPTYIQHSAHIAPGREGLFNLVRSSPQTLKYEPGLVIAEGDYVIAHGRFSGHGLAAVA